MTEPPDSIDPDAIAIFTEAGLFDPESPAAGERRELLAFLLERFTPDEIVTWAQRTHVYGVAARAVDQPPPLISAVEAAQRSGLSVELVTELRQALGFPVIDPTVPCMPDTVVDDLATFMFGVDLYGRDDTLAFARVLGWAASRVSEAARSMFGRSVEPTDGDRRSELELAQANEVAIAAWMQVQSIMEHLLAEHPLRDIGFVHAIMAGELRTAIAFVDLVGSTSWAEDVDSEQHSAALRRFEMESTRLASEHGARLVKLIGDEVMLVADDAEALCRVARAICELADCDTDLPSARGAVGFGRVTARDGDYFGPLVNAVARAAKVAEPGGIVVTAEVARALDPIRWVVTAIGAHDLAGVAEPMHLSHVALRAAAPG